MKELTFGKVWNDLLEALRHDPMVYTLARRKPNKVMAIEDEGIKNPGTPYLFLGRVKVRNSGDTILNY